MRICFLDPFDDLIFGNENPACRRKTFSLTMKSLAFIRVVK